MQPFNIDFDTHEPGYAGPGDGGSAMASKYGYFWMSQIHSISNAVQAAAQGISTEIDVSGIRALGNRTSWVGRARLRGRTILDAPMAHAKALARMVTEQGICDSWIDIAFAFRISSNCILRVSTERESDHIASTPDVSNHVLLKAEERTSPIGESPGVLLNTEKTCGEVHRLLLSLPLMQKPTEVSFEDGLYFFYEQGEESAHAPEGRIVRIGNHPRRNGRLKVRLQEHFRSSRNAKNGSVFRRIVGGALLRKNDPGGSCLAPAPGKGHWELQDGLSCSECSPIEDRVSLYFSTQMRFRCVQISDQFERNRFEAVLIATLSSCKVCRPSDGWLGKYAYSEKVRGSGMWNSEFVGGEAMTDRHTRRFSELVSSAVNIRRQTQNKTKTMTTTMQVFEGAVGTAAAESDRLPIVVIQCASQKNPGAIDFTLEGKRVEFVAQPNLAPTTSKLLYVRPDDRRPGGDGTWRDLVIQANSKIERSNQFVTAARLYRNSAYEKLLSVFGEKRLYILSAGWGLVRASYHLPDYDITFRNMAKEEKYKQRRQMDPYLDFNHLLDDYGAMCEIPICFFGGDTYRPLFASLLQPLRGSKSVFYRVPPLPGAVPHQFEALNPEIGFHNVPFPTSRLTNWQYECAEAFARHCVRVSTGTTPTV